MVNNSVRIGLLAIFCIFVIQLQYVNCVGLNVINEWKTIDYEWSSNKERNSAIQSKRYIPENNVILDVDVWEENGQKQVFVTTPRFKPGVPATLCTISNKKSKDGSLLLKPFPDWKSQVEDNRGHYSCDCLISVFRMQIDECGKLWVVDSGKLDIFTSEPGLICPAKLIVYDLKNGNKVVAKHIFRDGAILTDDILVNIVVDSRDSQCSKQYAFIADVSGSLLVYDAQAKHSWTAVGNYFYPDPEHGSFNIAGVKFDLMDGLFGLALGPIENNDRKLYFHPLADVDEFYVQVTSLLNETFFSQEVYFADLYHKVEGKRSSQSSVEVMTDGGVMFFPLLETNSLACWNIKKPLTKKNVFTAYKNDKTFQFVTGLKLIQKKTIYAVTSRLQNYFVGKVDTNAVTYRILSGEVVDFVKDCKCEPF